MTTIIAEIGQNFCGDMELAKRMILLAQENGADLVKFQLYDSEKLYGESGNNELTRDQSMCLFNIGCYFGVEVFFSVFDTERVKWCEEIGVKRYKIASGSVKDEELHRILFNIDKPKIISYPYGKGHSYEGFGCRGGITKLFCIPMYPTPLKYYFLEDSLHTFDGISDHSIGLDLAKIAIARGAKVIEKHFAIDHKTGIDAPWSMTPEELKELKRFAESVEECL